MHTHTYMRQEQELRHWERAMGHSGRTGRAWAGKCHQTVLPGAHCLFPQHRATLPQPGGDQRLCPKALFGEAQRLEAALLPTASPGPCCAYVSPGEGPAEVGQAREIRRDTRLGQSKPGTPGPEPQPWVRAAPDLCSRGRDVMAPSRSCKHWERCGSLWVIRGSTKPFTESQEGLGGKEPL